MKQIKVVENGVQAKKEIEKLLNEGFTHEDVYILAHYEERAEDLTEALDANDVGMAEQGVLNAVKNVFRSRGDELRSKMESLGFSNDEAEKYEKELDEGRVVVIATKSA